MSTFYQTGSLIWNWPWLDTKGHEVESKGQSGYITYIWLLESIVKIGRDASAGSPVLVLQELRIP